MKQNMQRRRQAAVAALAQPRVSEFVLRLAALLLAIAFWAAFFPGFARALDSENIRVAKALSNAYAEIVDEVGPAVVGIETEKIVRGGGLRDNFDSMEEFNPFEFFFNGPRGFGSPSRPRRLPDAEPEQRRAKGVGSGVIIDKEGHILTNNHVVADSDVIKVELPGEKGKTYKAEIVGRDANSDLAVIKLVDKHDNLPVARLGDSDALKPGNLVIAIGSPMGFKQSVTQGVVSAMSRNLNELIYERFIQTDASINPGNSGGPLVNLDAEVVGINAMISTRGANSGSIGIGFAIPINQAKSVVTQLIEKGVVTRGWLGIVMNPEDEDISLALGHDGSGVMVTNIDPNGPAAKGGIKKGDLIVSYDGIAVKDNDHLRYMVADTETGRDVPVTVIRGENNERVTLIITIVAQPEDLYTRIREPGKGGRAAPGADVDEVSSSLGITVRNIDDAQRKRYGLAPDLTGVVVAKVDEDSEAMEKGLRAGAVITDLDRKPVTDIASFRQIMKDSVGKGKIMLNVEQGSMSRMLMLNLK